VRNDIFLENEISIIQKIGVIINKNRKMEPVTIKMDFILLSLIAF